MAVMTQGATKTKPGKREARDAVVGWIEDICSKKGWKKTHLAQQSNLAPSTLLRLANNPDHTFLPSFSTIQAISNGANVSIPFHVLNAFGLDKAHTIEDAGTPISPPRLQKPKPAMSSDTMPMRAVSMLPRTVQPNASKDRVIERPERFQGDETAFAFSFPDDALEPFIPAGATGFATATFDPVCGDMVVMTMKDGRALVRILAEINEEGFVLQRAPKEGRDPYQTVTFDDFDSVATVRMIDY